MGTFGGAQPIVTDGLVFAVDAANYQSYPGSGTTWSDLSGNGNNGTLVNGPTYDEANGGSIELDGTDDVITIPNDGTFNFGLGDFTISLWLYFPYVLTHNYVHLFSFDFQTNWSLKAGSSSFGRGIYYYGGNQTYRSSVGDFGSWNIALGQWQHIAITRSSSGTLKTAYYNGGLVGTYSNTAKSISCSTIRIGHANSSEYTNQKRGPIQVYNRALTPSEISQNYNALKGRFGL